MNKLVKILLVVVLSLLAGAAKAQKVAVKTNALYWATGTVNFGGEYAFAPKKTIDFLATCNIPGLLYFGNKELNRKLWHWTVQPEVRFWHNEAFNRGFVGVHATTGAFDAGGIHLPLGVFPDFKDHRYEGWMAGVGASYGWQWYISPHWNVEATFGFGYIYLKYNSFHPQNSPQLAEVDKVHHYFGPTRIGVSFSYLFRSKK